MAARKPLVIINGQVQEISAGDTIAVAASEVDVVSMTNANAGALSLGTPVYVSAPGNVDKASAAASATRKVLGFVRDASIPVSGSGLIQTDGVISQANWTSVAGTTSLTAGATYYLSATTPGQITTTAPSSSGNYVIQVGIALSTTDFEIDTDRAGVLLS